MSGRLIRSATQSGGRRQRQVDELATMERKPAVAVVFHHIGPYHHTRLNAAGDRLSVTGIEWSAKGYDAWGSAATPERHHKVSPFPEATDHYPGKTELRLAFIAFQYFAGRLNSASFAVCTAMTK